MTQTVFMVLLLITSSSVYGGSCFDAEPDFNDCKVKANQGDAKAQYHLGQMYRSGDGVAQDYKEAVRWYRKAVEQRHARARYWLGVMSARGQGASEEDIKERRKRREQAEQRSKKRPRMAVGVYSKGQEDKQPLQPNGITIKAGHDGRFVTTVYINNIEAKALIDTGASGVDIPEHIAWKANLRKEKKFHYQGSYKYVYQTKIKKLKIGSLVFNNVVATRNEHTNSNKVIIGLNVLRQFKVTVQSGRMLIEEK